MSRQSQGQFRLVMFFEVSEMGVFDRDVFLSANKYSTSVSYSTVSMSVNLPITLTLFGDRKTAGTFYLSCLCKGIVLHLA